MLSGSQSAAVSPSCGHWLGSQWEAGPWSNAMMDSERRPEAPGQPHS